MDDNNAALQSQLDTLRKSYYKNLPEKLQQALESWKIAYQKEASCDDLEEVHRITHTIKGSSLTFNFQEIGEKATILDNYLKELIKNEASLNETEDRHFKQLFKELVLACKSAD